jgi:hypothetical protein
MEPFEGKLPAFGFQGYAKADRDPRARDLKHTLPVCPYLASEYLYETPYPCYLLDSILGCSFYKLRGIKIAHIRTLYKPLPTCSLNELIPSKYD